ncbi:hypothetical protein MH928_13415 [Flavobacterium sp. WW92]|uniref:DUF7793 family protein n=1 Tax=unclassified Flavobacterium TaxID=196869 RepID=UPI00222565C6|nr:MULTISPECIES: hypothetical protein [unclassified Flavobacterium]WDO12318.1 hypothetical protein MH928_13415 [Flavobacterium sp. WW92]
MHYENSFVSYSIEGGVLHMVCRSGVRITLADARSIVADRLMVQGERPLPALCELTGILDADSDALEFFAREGMVLISAIAFITHEKRHLEYLVKYFLKRSLPAIPSAVFSHLHQGLEFLKHRT